MIPQYKNQRGILQHHVIVVMLFWNVIVMTPSSLSSCLAFSNSHQHGHNQCCHGRPTTPSTRSSCKISNKATPITTGTQSPTSLFMTQEESSSTTTSDSTTSSSNNNIAYRKARIEDLTGIVDLLDRCFDDDDDDDDEQEEKVEPTSSSTSKNKNNWPSWNPFQKTADKPLDEKETLIQKLQQRLLLPQHILIVATDQSQIVGFMELGTMPAPIPIEIPLNLPNGQPSEQDTVKVRPERPFLANLAVDPGYRRQAMGSKLVQLALKIATQWESTKATEMASFYYFHPSPITDQKLSTLYLSVDCDNAGAIAFYKRLQFTIVLDESSEEEATRKGKRKPKLYLEKELLLSIDNEKR